MSSMRNWVLKLCRNPLTVYNLRASHYPCRYKLCGVPGRNRLVITNRDKHLRLLEPKIHCWVGSGLSTAVLEKKGKNPPAPMSKPASPTLQTLNTQQHHFQSATTCPVPSTGCISTCIQLGMSSHMSGILQTRFIIPSWQLLALLNIFILSFSPCPRPLITWLMRSAPLTTWKS